MYIIQCNKGLRFDKNESQIPVKKGSEKEGDVESTPQITTNKGGRRERFVRKGALNDAVNQTNIFSSW